MTQRHLVTGTPSTGILTDILCQTRPPGACSTLVPSDLVLHKQWKLTEELGVARSTAEVLVAEPLLPENLFYPVKKRRWEEHDTIARATMTSMLPAKSP